MNIVRLRDGRFVRFWASGRAKLTKMGDLQPRTPMNRRAKLSPLALSSAEKSVTVQTHKITTTTKQNKTKQTNCKRYIHTLPIGITKLKLRRNWKCLGQQVSFSSRSVKPNRRNIWESFYIVSWRCLAHQATSYTDAVKIADAVTVSYFLRRKPTINYATFQYIIILFGFL